MNAHSKIQQNPANLPELLDEILTYFKDDKVTLKSCALVSRVWMDPSLRLLFAKFVLRAGRCDYQQESPIFAAFLESVQPRVTAHIQTLVLCGESTLEPWEAILSLHTLNTLLANLPNLKTLKMSKLKLLGCRRGSRPIRADYVLRELQMFDMGIDRWDPKGATAEVFLLFKQIDMLHLERSYFDKPTERVSDVLSKKLNIGALHCADFYDPTEVLEMLGNVLIPSLHALDIELGRVENISFWGKLLRAVGPDFRELNLGLRDIIEWHTLDDPLNSKSKGKMLGQLQLSCCGSIETLGLRIYPETTEPTSDTSDVLGGWQTFLSVVSQAPPSIKHLVLYLSPYKTVSDWLLKFKPTMIGNHDADEELNQEVDDIKFGDLQRLMLKPGAFPALRRVSIVGDYYFHSDGVLSVEAEPIQRFFKLNETVRTVVMMQLRGLQKAGVEIQFDVLDSTESNVVASSIPLENAENGISEPLPQMNWDFPRLQRRDHHHEDAFQWVDTLRSFA